MPSRYPDAFTSGAPADKFSEDQAKQAMEDARHVIEFVREIGSFYQ
ncbi:MAG: HEPN domain-containing protein [Candidatus Hodarchaeota archaeon]